MTKRRLLLASLLATLACATGQGGAGGSVRVECNVPEATLWIDDVLLGRAAEWSGGRLVRPGFHRVEVRHPSHFTFYAEINVREREGTVVRAALHPLLE